MKVKQDFLCFGTFKIKNGSQVRFWEDTWLGGQGLKDQYPGLYNITREKFKTIAEVLTNNENIFSWRHTLFGSRLTEWNELRSRIANIQLTQEDDVFHSNLTQSGQFSVKSHYQALIKKRGAQSKQKTMEIKSSAKDQSFPLVP